MIRFIGKRILQMIPVVLLVATLIFGILYLVPGDPAQIMLGSTASEYELAEMREQLGLNRPFIVQLGEFLSDVFLHFDLGESYLTGAPVAGEIMQRLPRTLILGIASMVLAFGIGIPLGVTAAVHQNGWGDRISMIIALLGVSIPTFWLAMLFVLLFSLKLGWFPASGAYSIGGGSLIDRLRHLVLPLIASVAGHLWYFAYMVRNMLCEETRSEYIVLARAKGTKDSTILFRHCLKNVLPAYISLMAVSVAHILGGTYLVEAVFGYPGIGMLTYESAKTSDYNMLMVLCLLTGVVMIAANTIAELVNASLNPYMAQEEK